MDWYGRQISDELLDEIRSLVSVFYDANGKRVYKSQEVEDSNKLRDLLMKLYDEFGIKAIVKIVGAPLTYTKVRTIFAKLGIEISKRTVTEDLKRVRSINAANKGNFKDWTTKFHQRQERGMQGYYLTRRGSYVWLRSSYEYLYAKYLDENKIDWRFEERQYLLSSGASYRPDFFVYENDKLIEIIEVKSMYFCTSQERLDKAKLAAIEYELNIKFVTQIELEKLCNLNKNLREWKKVRLLTKPEEV